MSLALKACRTVICTNYDKALTSTYSRELIKEKLIEQKWKVNEIYIMKSRKSFKVELSSRKVLQKFLQQETITIGSIRLMEKQIEPEIDPTIQECLGCGVLQPNHSSEFCPNRKICLKCSGRDHKFYDCFIPIKDSLFL